MRGSTFSGRISADARMPRSGSHDTSFADLTHPETKIPWSVCPSGPGGGLKIHCRQLRVGSNPTADISHGGGFHGAAWMRKEERCKDPHRGKTAEILTTIPNLLQRFQYPARTYVFGLRP